LFAIGLERWPDAGGCGVAERGDGAIVTVDGCCELALGRVWRPVCGGTAMVAGDGDDSTP
jgi:hypothetical protein